MKAEKIIMSKKIPTTLAEQARVLGYRKFESEDDWEITIAPPRSVRELCLNAIGMALAEGLILHAQSLAARLPAIRPNFQYRVGRLANGCQTLYIGP